MAFREPVMSEHAKKILKWRGSFLELEENVFSIPFPVPSKTAFAITITAIENAIKRIITNELFLEIMFLNANRKVNIKNSCENKDVFKL